MNFTDGLDSLAGSIASIAFASYGVIAYLQDQTYLVAFCFTIVGALAGLSLVQRSSRPAVYGRYGQFGAGRNAGIGGIDDRSMAAAAGRWLCLCRRSGQRDYSTLLF